MCLVCNEQSISIKWEDDGNIQRRGTSGCWHVCSQINPKLTLDTYSHEYGADQHFFLPRGAEDEFLSQEWATQCLSAQQPGRCLLYWCWATGSFLPPPGTIPTMLSVPFPLEEPKAFRWPRKGSGFAGCPQRPGSRSFYPRPFWLHLLLQEPGEPWPGHESRFLEAF